MTTTKPLKLSSAFVMTMNLPHVLKKTLLLHVEKIIIMTDDIDNQHKILRMTCPLFYEDFITHIQSLNN
jgi:hypothetical protein